MSLPLNSTPLTSMSNVLWCSDLPSSSVFNTLCYSINAMNNDLMQKCLHKLIIKDGLPLLVEHLPLAKGFEGIGGHLSCMEEREIIKIIWELREHQKMNMWNSKIVGNPKRTNLLEVSNMIAEAAAGLTPLIFWVISEEHINRPQFCVTELGEVSNIRGEHQANDNAG